MKAGRSSHVRGSPPASPVPAPRPGRRRRAEAWGRWAETLAAWRLRLAGFRILARRFRRGGGEVDLIARRGRMLLFVEVKARGHGAGMEALTLRQWRRVAAAAEAFLAGRSDLVACDRRFDAVTVGRRGWPTWHRDAWRPDR